MTLARALLVLLLLTGSSPLRAAAEDADDWRLFGHALALAQVFARIAATAPDSASARRDTDEILRGESREANRAALGLLEAFGEDMPLEMRSRLAALGRDIVTIMRREDRVRSDAVAIERALRARRDLTSIGLRYHDEVAFLDAVRRNDSLAVELYILGQGVNLDARDAQGRSALEIARAAGNETIAALLRDARSRP
jgi:ankyrin repeat protein